MATGLVAQVTFYYSSTLEFTELPRATHSFTNVCKNSLRVIQFPSRDQKPVTFNALPSTDVKTPLPLLSIDLFYKTRFKTIYFQNSNNTNTTCTCTCRTRLKPAILTRIAAGVQSRAHREISRVPSAECEIITLGTKWRMFFSLRHAQTDQRLSLCKEADFPYNITANELCRLDGSEAI